MEIFGENLVVPDNFEKTAEGYKGYKMKNVRQPQAVCNPQTVLFCKKLSIDDPLTLILNLDLSVDNAAEGATDLSIDRTFVDSEVSTTTPVQKKMVLNLPKPVNDDDVPETEELQNPETPECVQSPVEEAADEPNSSKKFKRRNASIYQND